LNLKALSNSFTPGTVTGDAGGWQAKATGRYEYLSGSRPNNRLSAIFPEYEPGLTHGRTGRALER